MDDDDRISRLPDDILSYILTMLSIKDLFKISVLSKRWRNPKLWCLRRDLYFDIHNVFGSSENELLQTEHLIDVTSRLVDLDLSRDQFVKRVDQFMKNLHGSTGIDSLLVNFHLDRQQSNAIDQWLSFAIRKGVERINLLFRARPYVHRTSQHKHYKFDFGLFSETNASTLKHLCLEHCRLVSHPTNRHFKNLRSISLNQTKLDEMFIESLLSNCRQLEKLCLNSCKFKSSMPKIVSSSLCYIEVANCYRNGEFLKESMVELELYIVDCLKLTSMHYLGNGFDTMYFNTPVLNNILFFVSFKDLNASVAVCATFPELEILHIEIFLNVFLKVPTTLKIIQPLKNLKQLYLVIYNPDFLNNEEYDPSWILHILQASPLLQKLSVMYTHPNFVTNQKDIMDVENFSHDEVKVIELGGCVGNWFEIEFVMNVLKYAHKLEQIVASPYWRDDEQSDWNHDPVWFQSGRDRMSEKLQEAIGREKLVLV